MHIIREKLHISNSGYHDKLYDRRARRDKYEYLNGRFAIWSSVLTTFKHELHRMRGETLHPMFSGQRILKFQPIVRQKLTILCGQITT